MKYEITCTFCGNTQIYTPRAKKRSKKPHTDCKKCGKDFKINLDVSEVVERIPNLPKQKILEKVHDQKPAIFDNSKFIDDPDELLMSVAVRELNKPHPDPRWANVLITTRKENIGQSTKEGKIRSRFKSMSIKDIAKILSERPQDTLPKQDLEESS